MLEEKLQANSTLSAAADTAFVRNGQEPRYAIVTPVRDEEAFIGAMIESIAAQTVLPAQWIIVDDGSRDRTATIIQSYAERFDFIRLVQLPPREQRLPGGEEAIPAALKNLDLNDLDYLARFDADLVFPADYISRILKKFHDQLNLGIAGGGLYIEKNGALVLEDDKENHVRGALKMYRRACFFDIGGLTTQIGWDTRDEVSAWSKGWETRTFADITVIHRRPTGEGIAAYRVYRQRGRGEYLTWSDPLFVIGKSVKTATAERSIIKPMCYLWGFFMSYLSREPRVKDVAFTRTRRASQRDVMRRTLSIQALSHKPGNSLTSRG